MFWFVILVILALSLVIGIFVLNRFLIKATRDAALVRTGVGGQRVVIDGGTIVFPFLHRAEKINMRSSRVTMQRSGAQAIITGDRLRVDVELEAHIRVRPDRDGIATAAQALGLITFHEEELQGLLGPELIDAVQSTAAERSLEELHEGRADFTNAVVSRFEARLASYGLASDSISLIHLDQTPFSALDDSNVFNAVGMRKLADTISENRKARIAIETETEVEISKRKLAESVEILAIDRQREEAEIARRLDTEQRRIATDTEIDTQRIAAERLIETARIERERDTKQSEIERDLHLRRREMEALTEIEIQKADNAITISSKRAEEVAQQAKTELARMKAVEAEEGVQTSRDIAAAERVRKLALLRAEQDGAVDDLKTKSEASSILARAKAESEAANLRGKGEKERLTAEAAGQRAWIEAENQQSEALLQTRIEMHRLDRLPEIATQMMKPVEKIDSIRINHIGGAGGGNGSQEESSPFNQALQSILGMSVQLPMMKKLGDEIGLDFDAQLAGRTADAAGRASIAKRPKKDG